MGRKLGKWPAAICLVIGTILCTRSAQTTFAADKPIHSSIVTLACCGAVVLALSRILTHESPVEAQKNVYEAIPLRERRDSEGGQDRDPLDKTGQDETYSASLRRLRICFLALIVALCLRVEVLHRVLLNVQCSTRSCAPVIPLAFAVVEWWRVRRKRGHTQDAADEDEDEDASAYEALGKLVANMPASLPVSVAMVTLGAMWALAATASPRSTYICAATLPFRVQIPHLQLLGTCLDVLIVWCVGQLLSLQYAPVSRRLASVGTAFLLSSFFLFGIGTVYYFVEEADRMWIMQISRQYVWSLLRLDMYIAFTLSCALALVLHVGIMTTSLLATFTSILTVTTVSAWKNAHPFPPSHLGVGLLAISVAMLGIVAYCHMDSAAKQTPTRSPLFPRGTPNWLQLILLVIFLTWTGLIASSSTTVNYHPIDMLLYQAGARHDIFVQHAFTSNTLTRAVQIYKHRYNRHPPPGFDRWHQYATARKSVVVDDFDSINTDLLPFYAMHPKLIRERTWELISNPWNDAAGLTIRDGKVSVMDNGLPGTHAWMLEGLVEMTGKFSEHLPDMDLAFNINDECRVAVPHTFIKAMRLIASRFANVNEPPRLRDFSSNRAAGWKSLPGEPSRETPLTEHSWQKIFNHYGANGCPSSSPARTTRTWDTSTLCTACMAPHSLGAFLANWTLAADICHQPDLADLHGIFLSPAAFKATHELYPFFSQSKVGGFNDILYPSAWNYMEKARYAPNTDFPDPPFSEKKDTLFWRGATSEGVSQGWGQWKGMVRQRFVALFSENSTERSVGLLPVGKLIPPNTTDFNGKILHNKLRYSALPASNTTLADVHVAENIVRCANKDCEDQAKALAPLVSPIDFQEHWKYKYLLDLDGAGFSGRFLPFLRSNSLPVKAGLFREWWDARVTAWKHFVPVDVRGVGIKGTMAYFQDGKHDKEAARIAQDGREWAERVLRREDMEIYMFRLLLEWGRITDDRRDELGFHVDGGG